jgi:hypothetical protein
MKHVEQRGTADVSGMGSSASMMQLGTYMIPAVVIMHGPSQRQMQSQSQTQCLECRHWYQLRFSTPFVPLQEKKRVDGSAKEREREREREKETETETETERTQEPPSPSVIATLQTTDNEDYGRRRRGGVS